MRPPCIESSRFSPLRIVSTVTIALAILTLSGLVVACEGGSGSATTVTPTKNGSGAQVVMEGFAFTPASVTIKVGETVTWTNQDSASHTVVGDKGEFGSDGLGKADSFGFSFTQAGTYGYHCGIHPSMRGTVVVQ